MGVKLDTIKRLLKPNILNHDSIGMMWALLNEKVEDNDAIDRYRDKVAWAVVNEELPARKISIKNLYTGGFDTQPNSPTFLHEASDAWHLDKQSVLFHIYRDDFRSWLIDSKQWPLAEGCALIHWFGDENYANTKALAKKRKKLKPLERETNTALLLLYEIFDQYHVKYLNELSAIRAWGKIISGEFSSELIESVGETKKSITLKDGDRLLKIDFLEKYRKRFEVE